MGAISEYLNVRKEKWLKNHIKTQMSDKEIAELENNAEEKFSIEKWVPDAAKRAKQLSIASHVCKFSHPGAKTSSVISKSSFKNDGYLHSGNVEYELDAFGNAAAVDVFDFLLTVMNDGRTVLEHLESDSEEIRRELDFPGEEYVKIKTEFLKVKKDKQDIETDERLKQVYFPVGNKYHLLSLMTSSGILRVLQARIIEMREEAKASRGNNEQQERKYDEILDLTVTAFGGTKPQNISVLNLQNHGRAYLLSSKPPTISNRELTRPRQDFFNNTLRIKNFSEEFQYLHTLFECDRNNLEIRNKIKKTIDVIIDHVMISVYKLRELHAGWTSTDSCSQLPLAQKIWLDDSYAEMREKDGAWLDEISVAFARWILRAYEMILKNDSIKLGDGEMVFLQNRVEAALLQDKGSLG